MEGLDGGGGGLGPVQSIYPGETVIADWSIMSPAGGEQASSSPTLTWVPVSLMGESRASRATSKPTGGTCCTDGPFGLVCAHTHWREGWEPSGHLQSCHCCNRLSGMVSRKSQVGGNSQC